MATITQKFREFIWHFGIGKSCPWCGGKLQPHGNVDYGVCQYRCLNPECDFGKDPTRDKEAM